MTPTPLSYLSSAGPAAAPLTQLAWGLGGISVAVTVIVTITLVWGIWRRRAAPADASALEPAGSPGAGMAWIYVGLGISVPVLAACTVWTLFVLGEVMHPASKPQLTLQVTAHQWWWEVRYLDPVAGRVFTTANEIHIPTGVPVRVVLSSPDVIHSFWVPKLAGKMDVIPGVTNVTWIQAATPGRSPPAGISFAVHKQTEIRISGIDKQLVGEIAARIRRIRPPEPYKGKGVRYAGESVRRKEGKKK